MFTIHLNKLRFFSFHGLYEAEKILGNDYEVNAAVTIAAKEQVTELSQTVDYVSLYTIIKQRMAIATPLLETIAQDLAQLIYDSDNRILSIDITITKVYPPIPSFSGNIGVSYKKEF